MDNYLSDCSIFNLNFSLSLMYFTRTFQPLSLFSSQHSGSYRVLGEIAESCDNINTKMVMTRSQDRPV